MRRSWTRKSMRVMGVLVALPAWLGAEGCGGSVVAGDDGQSAGGSGLAGKAGGSSGQGGTRGDPLPTDAWIAFDSDGAEFSRDIYVIRSDGSGLRRLTAESSTDVEPSFSPDGSKLAFASDREGATMQIFVLELATATVTRVTSRGSARTPAFSRDGQRIGYRSGGAVYTIGLDGGAEQTVVAGSKCCPGSPFGAPVFSPDGQWIAYDDYNAIYAVHLDGSSEWTIVPPTTGDQSQPSLSPDGLNLALQASCMTASPRAIVVVSWNGISGLACSAGRMVSPDGEHPAWGPADAIAFHTSSGARSIRLWKDGVINPVTNGPADDRNPAWSPPGATIP